MVFGQQNSADAYLIKGNWFEQILDIDYFATNTKPITLEENINLNISGSTVLSDVTLNSLEIRHKGWKSAVFPQSGKLKIAALIFNDRKESSTDLYSVDWSLSKVENVSQKNNLSSVNSFAATSSQCRVKNVRIADVVKTKPILLPKDFL